MSLNLSKLKQVRNLENGAVEARCPACAEDGHDTKGEHLLIKPDGRFGCCANPNDKEHRKRIFALAGDMAPRSIKIAVPAFKIAAPAVISGVLGRLGRGSESPIGPEAASDASDGVAKVQPELDGFRTPRTGYGKSIGNGQPNSRTLRTPQYPKRVGEEIECLDRIEVQGVCVGASEASEPAPVLLESGHPVRDVRMPYLTPGGTLVIPFDSPEHFHWWKGGQSVAETLAEVESWTFTP